MVDFRAGTQGSGSKSKLGEGRLSQEAENRDSGSRARCTPRRNLQYELIREKEPALRHRHAN